MDEGLYRTFRYVAVALTVVLVGWSLADSVFKEKVPGSLAYREGENYFQDGDYRAALAKYDEALAAKPDSPAYVRAKARTLMQLGRNAAALGWFDRAVALQPFFGGTYANRGILYDRMGRYRKAVADYEKALKLDSSVGDGPSWLVRFLRNEPKAPPTVADRLAYLKEELAKPEDQRLMRVPGLDAKQRTYQQ
ncbi:MAG: tetratricopeptide repeat protein [Arenicellales bacterium]